MIPKYSLVTVAYPGDRGFMRLQARSVGLYTSRALIEEIIVVENTPPTFPTAWREQVRHEYGALRDLVKFVPGATIAAIPAGTPGWFSQQILKLKVAEIVRAPRYLILDAKNHFIFPLTRQHVERDGKPRMFVHGYVNHPLRRYLEPILQYFNLAPDHINRFLPTTPPFYADTALVNAMIKSVSEREQRPFEDVFLKSGIRFTEFFMLAAFILSRKQQFEDYYHLSGGGHTVIWTHDAGDEALIQREVNRSETQQSPLFAVHRGAFPLLSAPSRTAIASFWHRRNLFDTFEDALNFIDDPNNDQP